MGTQEPWQRDWPHRREITDSQELLDLLEPFPDLDGHVQMLWHSGYWDGPLSGYVEVDGEKAHWVKCVADYINERPGEADASCSEDCPEYPGAGKCCMKEWDRVFLVYKLTPEQDTIERANHALFRKHVGTHTDYDDEPGTLMPRAEMDKFYKTDKPQMAPLEKSQVIGHVRRLFVTPKSRRAFGGT